MFFDFSDVPSHIEVRLEMECSVDHEMDEDYEDVYHFVHEHRDCEREK